MAAVKEEENYFVAYQGGVVECSKAITFPSDEPNPDGSIRMIDLPDRVTVTFGKKKSALNGRMVKALHQVYESDEKFRAWCDIC